jgi:hypothetical protein
VNNIAGTVPPAGHPTVTHGCDRASTGQARTSCAGITQQRAHFTGRAPRRTGPGGGHPRSPGTRWMGRANRAECHDLVKLAGWVPVRSHRPSCSRIFRISSKRPDPRVRPRGNGVPATSCFPRRCGRLPSACTSCCPPGWRIRALEFPPLGGQLSAWVEVPRYRGQPGAAVRIRLRPSQQKRRSVTGPRLRHGREV